MVLKDTDDTRETPSVFVCRNLLDERAELHVYDPKVEREQMFIEFQYTTNTTEDTVPGLKDLVVTAKDPLKAADGAHAIAILTEWDEFKKYNYERIYDVMAKPVSLVLQSLVM